MKSTFKVLFLIKRNATKQSGKAPIIARITLDGIIAQISTQLEIEPSLWNIKHGKASGKAFEANIINNSIDNIKSTIFGHYQNFREKKANIVKIPILVQESFRLFSLNCFSNSFV